MGLIPGLGRSPGEGNGNPLEYSCLENPMDRGDWWATVHGVTFRHNLATPWTVACQAPLSMGFSRHEYSSGLPFPSPGDLFNPGTEPGSPTLQVVVLSGAQYTFLNKLLSLKQAN